MVTVIFTVAGLAVGLGLGTQLAKWRLVKNTPTHFQWNSTTYEVRKKK